MREGGGRAGGGREAARELTTDLKRRLMTSSDVTAQARLSACIVARLHNLQATAPRQRERKLKKRFAGVGG